MPFSAPHLFQSLKEAAEEVQPVETSTLHFLQCLRGVILIWLCGCSLQIGRSPRWLGGRPPAVLRM
jgi:hypothetical protein